VKLEDDWESLKARVSEKAFLSNKGLANEVPYWIFCYEPQYELYVRDNMPLLLKFLEQRSIKALSFNLFDAMVDTLQTKGYLEKAIDLEKTYSSSKLLQALSTSISLEGICDQFAQLLDSNHAQIGFVTGVGSAWPVIRTHLFLNKLQQIKSDVPIVVMYPGKYEQNKLRLFNKFSSHYYRAFQLVGDSNEQY